MEKVILVADHFSPRLAEAIVALYYGHCAHEDIHFASTLDDTASIEPGFGNIDEIPVLEYHLKEKYIDLPEAEMYLIRPDRQQPVYRPYINRFKRVNRTQPPQRIFRTRNNC